MSKRDKTHKQGRDFPPIIVEELPVKPAPKKQKKPLDPEMAQRKIRALEKFLSDGDIDAKQFWTMKDRIIAAMVG
jgi:hypothetical protein